MYGHSAPDRARPLHFTAFDNLTKLSLMNGDHQGITKRQLGTGLAIFGIIGFLGIMSIDLIDIGRQGGIGPAQSLALLLMVAVTLIGLSLIPLGNAPA